MKLREFIDLKILRDNVEIHEFKKDCIGLGDLTKHCALVRNYSIVTEDSLLKAGLEAKYLDYEITELCGSRQPFKTMIIISE